MALNKEQRDICDALETETIVLAECEECGEERRFEGPSDYTVSIDLHETGWRVVDGELRCPECVDIKVSSEND